jgi:hypothetical protein
MSVELVLLLKFPREVFQVAPPVPVTLAEGPQIASEFGRIGFYFDDWDAPDPNREGGPPAMTDVFYTHLALAARAIPEKLDFALTVPGHPYASAVCSDPGEDDEPDDVARADELCDRLFGDPALGDYLGRLGEHILGTIVAFLTILRIGYGQYLVPRGLPVTTARKHWVLAGGAQREVSDAFLDRLLGLRRWDAPGDINEPVQPEHWPEITARLGTRRAPPFSEVLLASARGQCDPELGNPRLALVEAVGALEVEARAIMSLSARRNGAGWPGATPHARLAWIREQLGGAPGVTDALYRRCMQAIRDRDALAEQEGRDLAPEQVRAHVEALGRLTRLARRAREAAG